MRDGTRVRIRPVRPGDRAALAEFVAGLSDEAIELRYFDPVSRQRAVDHLVGPSGPGRTSVVLEVLDGPTGRLVGQAEFDRDPVRPTVAEVAFLIADSLHGKGAATLLLWHLADRARAVGVEVLEAVTGSANWPMLGVLYGSGFPCTVAVEGGLVRVRLEITSGPCWSRAVRAERPRDPP